MSKELERFKAFLASRGAEVLSTTNEYEVIRFRANGTVSVIYEGRRGTSFVGEAQEAWSAFKNGGKGWKTDSRKEARRWMTPVMRTLLDRDGNSCFFCKKPMLGTPMSIEHLLALAHGGSNHLSNLVMAHPACNGKVGHLSIMDKVRVREAAT